MAKYCHFCTGLERTPMDFDSTLPTLPSNLPDALIDQAVSAVTEYVSVEVEEAVGHALNTVSNFIPAQVDLGAAMKFLLFFSACSLILGVLGRIFLGKRSSLNHALSSVMGILLLYALTIVIYTFKPWNLEELLSPLPFVTFSGDYMILLPLRDAQIPALCTQVLSLVILAFLMNLLDTFIPRGKTIFSWYFLRFLTVGIAMVLHLLIRWAINTYLPEVLVTYAPTILLILLAAMLLLGLLNLFLGLVLTVVNPVIGALYTFFFSNVLGKQLTKAVFTAAILCAVVFLLEYFGYTVICITGSALLAYIPLAAVLLILWYLIGHVL